MEVKDVREEIKELEAFIEKSVREFEAITGTKIEYINLERANAIGQPDYLLSTSVKCIIK
jgi:hypothetical protein